MYCIKCGVELQKGIPSCPLCGLKVYHPDLPAEDPELYYPSRGPQTETSVLSRMLPLTLLMLIPMILCTAIDLRINHRIVWSGFALGGIFCAYICFIFPGWFKARHPVIFFPADMLCLMLLTLYICRKTGGSWFWSFAFPVTLVLTVILETQIALLSFIGPRRKGFPAVILGGGFIAFGFFCLLIEGLLRLTFKIRLIGWSFIPFIVLLFAGGLMILIGLNRPLRDALHKRFFI